MKRDEKRKAVRKRVVKRRVKRRTPTILPPLSQKLSRRTGVRRLSSLPLRRAFPRDAARLRGGVRVLREWVLARSAPASPLARACALHLLCWDAGICKCREGAGQAGCALGAAACDCAYGFYGRCWRAVPLTVCGRRVAYR